MLFSPMMTRRAACAPRSADMALQRFLLDAMPAAPARRTPGYTVAQDEKATTLQLDVPGLAREQLQITIEGAQVQVKNTEGAPRLGATHAHRRRRQLGQAGARRAHPHPGPPGPRRARRGVDGALRPPHRKLFFR